MDPFLQLPAQDRALAFQQAEAQLRLPAASIEKDFWVCFTLRALFSLSAWQDNLTFKGGTSLSKGWNLIQRFSEDIDLVIDRPFLGINDETAPETAPSGKQRRKRLDILMERAREAIHDRLLPALQRSLDERIPAEAGDWTLLVDPDVEDQQTLLFQYPSVLDAGKASTSAYIRPVVRIELGARSDTEPLDNPEIEPDVAKVFPDAVGPSRFRIRAVSPKRTFVEKAMLLHEHACRATPRPPGPRLSRHYYDLYRLIEAGVAIEALAEPDLFKSVVEHREIFFGVGLMADYGYAGLTPEKLHLLPNEEHLPQWRADYAQMRESMFYGESPDFDEIMRVVGRFGNSLQAIDWEKC